MKIIDQSVEIITEPNPLNRIELVGRVCWKSEHRITEDSAKPFVAGLIKRGHTSPLEHARVVIPKDHLLFWIIFHEQQVYGIRNRLVVDYDGRTESSIKVNLRDIHSTLYRICGDGLKFDDFFNNVESLPNADDYMTVKFITDIGMSRELIRHRQMSFMELSTRYVNYEDGIEFIKPIGNGANDMFSDEMQFILDVIEAKYINLIQKGWKPQEARAILPLCTKTELYMTGMLSQWKDVFALRESPAAHPQMRALMALLREEMKKNNIEVE